MPILKAAKKYVGVAERKTAVNKKRKKEMKQSIKQIDENLKNGKKDEAQKLFSQAQKAIDKAVKKGVIKKRTGARKKANINKRIKNSK